jgi:type IV secretion system protein VirD4
VAQDSATGQHFRRQATILLTAAQLHLLYTTATASLGHLWTLLTQQYASLQACLKAMLRTAHTTLGRHPAIVQLATEISNISGDRELSGVWTTALGPLLPYADWLTQRSTDTSTVDLNDLQYGPVPMALYLIAPSTSDLDRLAPVYRVISEMAVRRLQDHAPRSAPHRLLVIADEAPSYGYSKTLDRGAAETAKYGIKLMVVAQDIPQLEDAYGRVNSVWGNTHTKVFFAPDSDLTAKRLSENFLGQETVEQPVLSRQQRFGTRATIAYQQVGRPLMTADELRAMHPEAAIVYRTGLRPILCGKTNVLRDPEWQGRYGVPAP